MIATKSHEKAQKIARHTALKAKILEAEIFRTERVLKPPARLVCDCKRCRRAKYAKYAKKTKPKCGIFSFSCGKN